MPFAPLYDRILVRTKVKDTRTASGIVIPSSREQRPDQGEVVAVGHGHFLTDGKVGDIVQFDPARSGEEITVDGEALVLFHEHEIMGIITSK
jgi:chaperonin GroES